MPNVCSYAISMTKKSMKSIQNRKTTIRLSEATESSMIFIIKITDMGSL